MIVKSSDIKLNLPSNEDFVKKMNLLISLLALIYDKEPIITVDLDNYFTKNMIINHFQRKLENGVNIKTINGISVLGSGDIKIEPEKVDLSQYWTFNETRNYVGNYYRTEIAKLINSAPETLDTLGEIAVSLQENQETIDILNQAIGEKASKDYVHEYVNNSIDGIFEDLVNMEF